MAEFDLPEFLVRTENLTRSYQIGGRQVLALRGINLTLPRGVLTALEGRSGSGKTTLLNLLGGLDQPTSGNVYFDGQNLAGMDEDTRTHLRRQQIGFIFQSFALLPSYSAFENVELALRISGRDARSSRDLALECLKTLGLENRKHNYPDELSGGQQQCVAIARALATHPDLILADEPTGELDTNMTRQVFSLFRFFVERENIAFLVASHNPIIEEYADIIYTLQDGQLAIA